MEENDIVKSASKKWLENQWNMCIKNV